MKIIRTVIGTVAVLIVAAILAVVFLAGPVVHSIVEQLGSRYLGVPVTVDQANVSLLGGSIRLNGLIVGNPAGFKTPWLLKVGELKILLNLETVTKTPVIITAILANKAEVNYEKGLTGSNLSSLLNGLDKKAAEEPPSANQENTESDSASVIIEDFLLEKGTVHLSTSITGAHAMELPLPPIHLTGIGKESNGTSIREIVVVILRVIAGSVTRVATGSVELVGKGLKEAGSLAVDGIKGVGKAGVAVGDGAVKGVTAVGKTAGTGVKEVGKGVVAVGETALGGVKAVGGAAVKGVEKLTGGARKNETNASTTSVP